MTLARWIHTILARISGYNMKHAKGLLKITFYLAVGDLSVRLFNFIFLKKVLIALKYSLQVQIC